MSLILTAKEECQMPRFYPGHQCSNYGDCPRPRPATVEQVCAWLRQQGATIEEVGEPGYYDHHGNDGAFVAPGRYLVFKLDAALRVEGDESQ